MQADKVDTFIMTNGKLYPPNQIPIIREKLLALDDSKFTIISSIDTKNPTTMFIISFFVGVLGVDRFMLGQVGMGVLKLLTGGVCGILAIIDWVTIMGKTRQWNFDQLMSVISTIPATTENAGDSPNGTSENISSQDSRTLASENSNNNSTVTSSTVSTAQETVYRKAPPIQKENINNIADFLKSFIKQPIQTVQSGTLGFIESLILIGVQAIGLALMLFILTFRVNSGYSFLSYSGFSLPSKIGVFFTGLIFSIILTAVLSLLILFFGKIIYKGKFNGVEDYKKLLGYIAASEIPLTAALIISAVLSVLFPFWFINIVLAFGCVSAIAFAPTIFKSVFDLTDDQCIFGTMFAYTIQSAVILGLLSQIGSGLIKALF